MEQNGWFQLETNKKIQKPAGKNSYSSSMLDSYLERTYQMISKNLEATITDIPQNDTEIEAIPLAMDTTLELDKKEELA